MSRVKIEGNATGSGTLTISAPNTNTDRTLTLPDGAGEILTDASTLSSSNLSGALPAIDGSALTGVGGSPITVADMWVLSSTTTKGSGWTSPFGSWSQLTSTNQGWYNIGSSISHSSGTFSFPETGMYLITGHFRVTDTGGHYTHYTNFNVTTNNGSNWYEYGLGGQRANDTYHTYEVTVLFNVTNTTNCKLRVHAYAEVGASYVGSADYPHNYITFLRIGDSQSS